MAAPKGNRFWEARSSHGRKPKFASPDDLWNACKEYFQWVDDNPLWEAKAFAFQGEVTVEALPKMRAMTLDGLFIFLDIDDVTWQNYRKRKDFFIITSRVDKIIRHQKFAGAAAELLNPNIIARDLGLAEKQQRDVVVKTEPEQLSEIDGWLEGVAGGQTTESDTPTRTH